MLQGSRAGGAGHELSGDRVFGARARPTGPDARITPARSPDTRPTSVDGSENGSAERGPPCVSA